jgi:NitT/TauT family transport system ATP-binding protein
MIEVVRNPGTEVHVRAASCGFGPQNVFEGISFAVAPGEVVAVRGRNGAGKTTLLNMIAGMVTPTAGKVDVIHNGPVRVGYVPQNYSASLLPWLNVLDNITLPLRFSGTAAFERARRARAVVQDLDLGLRLRAYPSELSGGERQKVAIARAVIDRPNLLLLDEPFANLDATTRFTLRERLVPCAETYAATLLVSHDLDDCILLADRVVLLAGAPATIVSVVPVALPRPRRDHMLTSGVFLAARAQVLAGEGVV